MHLGVALPEVCASNEVISVDEGGTFVPEQTPDSVSVLDGPVRSFLRCYVSTCMNTKMHPNLPSIWYQYLWS